MLTEYLEKAMAQANVEKTEDGWYFASIPQFKGVWGDGDTPKESCKELRAGTEASQGQHASIGCRDEAE